MSRQQYFVVTTNESDLRHFVDMRVEPGGLDVKARDSFPRKLAQGRNISRSVPQFHRAAPSTVTSNVHESSGRQRTLQAQSQSHREPRHDLPGLGLHTRGRLERVDLPQGAPLTSRSPFSLFYPFSFFYFFSFFYLKRQFSMMSLPRSASIQADGMAFAPYTMPASAPATAAVVSVSSPRLTARRTHSS